MLWSLRRDLRLALRKPADWLLPLAFFWIVVSLFPFALGADSKLLARVAPAVFWVAVLLTELLALSRLFVEDERHHILEQWFLSGRPIAALVAGKLTAHWITCGLALSLVSPLLGLQFGLENAALIRFVPLLAVGTAAMTSIGGLGAALMLMTRSGGASTGLLALLVLPLQVPVLIFGAGALEAASFSLPVWPAASALCGIAIAAAVLTPPAIAMALRIATS
jgi:heme exporter protein B